MPRSVAQKMGIKQGSRTIFVNAPVSAVEAILAPSLDVSASLDGEFGYIHLFTVTQTELDDLFPTLKAHLGPTGMFWVSWPKSRKLDSNLTLPHVIRIGYRHGLVESTCLSVDSTWSALKFTHPKPGKVYRNSFGQLPS